GVSGEEAQAPRPGGPVARRDPGQHAAPVVPVTGGSGHSGGSGGRRGSAGGTGRRGGGAPCAAGKPAAGHALAIAGKVEGRGGRVLKPAGGRPVRAPLEHTRRGVVSQFDFRLPTPCSRR